MPETDGKFIGQIINEAIGSMLTVAVGVAIIESEFCIRCRRRLIKFKPDGECYLLTRGVVTVSTGKHPAQWVWMHGKCWRRRRDGLRMVKKIRKKLRRLGMKMHEGAFHYVCCSNPRMSLQARLDMLKALEEGALLDGGFMDNPHFIFESAVRLMMDARAREGEG